MGVEKPASDADDVNARAFLCSDGDKGVHVLLGVGDVAQDTSK